MNSGPEYALRTGKGELFVAAPGDDIHLKAFTFVAPEASFDSVLSEWRVPWDSDRAEELISKIRETVGGLSGTGLLYGYAQTTHGEGAEIQVDALREAGIPDGRIFFDNVAGRYPTFHRLVDCVNSLRAGDTLVVYSINRLARSLKQLVQTTQEIQSKSAYIRSLTEKIDTSGVEYKHFVEHIAFAAEFEIVANSARTKAGIKEALAKGRRGGRPSKLTKEKLEMVSKLILNGMPITEVAKIMETSRATIYRCFPDGPASIREASKLEGQPGVDKLLDTALLRINTGVTYEKRAEILRLHGEGKSAIWIADHIGHNRETIRAIIKGADK